MNFHGHLEIKGLTRWLGDDTLDWLVAPECPCHDKRTYYKISSFAISRYKSVTATNHLDECTLKSIPFKENS